MSDQVPPPGPPVEQAEVDEDAKPYMPLSYDQQQEQEQAALAEDEKASKKGKKGDDD